MQHGFASRNGLTAAALAASGYVGIKQVFERPYGGWLAVCGEGHRTHPEHIYKGLGDLWETERIAVKAYSAMGLLHAAIDAALELRAKADVSQDPEDRDRHGRSRLPAWRLEGRAAAGGHRRT